MTDKLKKAVAKAEQLPDEQQDALAAIILAEIADEASWDAAFARSHDVLQRLDAEAGEEDRRGETQDLDPEKI